jgi:hypothetical protein
MMPALISMLLTLPRSGAVNIPVGRQHEQAEVIDQRPTSAGSPATDDARRAARPGGFGIRLKPSLSLRKRPRPPQAEEPPPEK